MIYMLIALAMGNVWRHQRERLKNEDTVITRWEFDPHYKCLKLSEDESWDRENSTVIECL
jgi:hypothetical protein